MGGEGYLGGLGAGPGSSDEVPITGAHSPAHGREVGNREVRVVTRQPVCGRSTQPGRWF